MAKISILRHTEVMIVNFKRVKKHCQINQEPEMKRLSQNLMVPY